MMDNPAFGLRFLYSPGNHFSIHRDLCDHESAKNGHFYWQRERQLGI